MAAALAVAAAAWAAGPAASPRFVGYAYSDVNASAVHNIVVMATVSSRPYTGHNDKHKGWIPPDPLNATADLVNATMALPAGRRAIRALDLYHNGSAHPLDNILPADANCSGKWPQVTQFSGVWWDHGAAEVAALHEQVLSAYKAAGGELDFWAVDDESSAQMHSWWIATGPDDECGKAKWTAIQNDARFPQLHALLKQLGFGAPDTSSPHWLFEYMTCCGGDLNLGHYRAWAAAASYYFAHWISVGQASVVAKHFPSAVFTEYGSEVPGWRADCSPGTTGFNDGNVSAPDAAVTPSNNPAPVPGGAQSPALYMDVSDGLAQTLKRYYKVAPYPNTPFNAFRQAVNRLRSGVLGTAAVNRSVEMIPYLAYKSYKASRTNASADYQELILHGGVTGVNRFLMWNTHAVGDDNPAVSRSLDELEAVVSAAQGPSGARAWHAPALADWSTGYVVTATVMGGACLWRFSPDLSTFPPDRTPAAFVSSKPGAPTLVLSGMRSQAGQPEQLSFPGGTIAAPRGVAAPAAGGLWVRQSGACRVQLGPQA